MAKLRAVKPATVEKKLKLFVYGGAGVGKTWASIRFPATYLIDCERGATNKQYTAALEASGGAYLDTSDLDEIIEEVRSLITEKHNFKTLVVDPVTTPYNNAVDASIRDIVARSKDPKVEGTEFGRHKTGPDRSMKRLMALCAQIDMSVIFTAHSKGKWEKVGDKIEQVGSTFDGFNKSEYLFDLVLEVQARGRDERVAIVRKTRIEEFPLGDVFPFSYEEIAARYGHDILERRAGVVALVTPEQVARINHLVDVLKIEPEIIDKWFVKANTDRFDEFSQEAGAKVLAWLESRLTAIPVPTTITINQER